MKESTGGALLMGFAAIMLLIFIIMSAFFISYGKLFRLKDKVINSIEQKEGLKASEIDQVIRENYKRDLVYEVCYDIIYEEDVDGSKKIRGFTEKVKLFMDFDRNVFGSLFKLRIPIEGETRIIEKGTKYDAFIKNYSQPLGGLPMKECSD